jgi:hypothetical protein
MKRIVLFGGLLLSVGCASGVPAGVASALRDLSQSFLMLADEARHKIVPKEQEREEVADPELQKKALKEQELRAKELKEKELKEKQLKEKERKGKEPGKSGFPDYAWDSLVVSEFKPWTDFDQWFVSVGKLGISVPQEIKELYNSASNAAATTAALKKTSEAIFSGFPEMTKPVRKEIETLFTTRTGQKTNPKKVALQLLKIIQKNKEAVLGEEGEEEEEE